MTDKSAMAQFLNRLDYGRTENSSLLKFYCIFQNSESGNIGTIRNMDIIVRNETPEDYKAIEEILCAAFPSDAESKVVYALRTNGHATISLVAIGAGKILGHILFSPVHTHPPTPQNGLGLAPMAVHADFRSQGIGSQLIRAGLQACRDLLYDYCVVLGSPKYYGRFGFEKASTFDLQNEYGVDDEFMVVRFTTVPLGGLVKYSPEFAFFSV